MYVCVCVILLSWEIQDEVCTRSCRNEKQVLRPALKNPPSAHTRDRTSDSEHLMIRINYSIACLLGFSSTEYAIRMRSGAPCEALRAGRVRRRHVTDAVDILSEENFHGLEMKMQVGSQRQKEKKWSRVFRAAAATPRPLWIIPRYICRGPLLHTAVVMVPFGQDCVLCSVHCGNHPRTAGRNTF